MPQNLVQPVLQELEGNFRFAGSWRGSYIFSSLCQKGGHSQFLRHLCKHTNSKRARAEAPEELGQPSLPRADCASKLQAESSRLGPPVAKVTLKIHSSESSKQNFTPHFHTETAGQAGVATKFGRNKKRRAASVEAQQGYEAHLKVSNFYSDLLYQPWHCAHVPLKAAWLAGDGVPRCAGLTPEAFRKGYEIPNLPVILTDVVRHSVMGLGPTCLTAPVQGDIRPCIQASAQLLHGYFLTVIDVQETNADLKSS